MRLDTHNHDRESAGLTYVYPVVSRRSRGLSVGINLNTNRACNWACVYCQVEGLQRGAAPALNGELLRRELDGFLSEVVGGDWLQRHAPVEARRINDLALSGNGEATTCPDFEEAVNIAGEVKAQHGLHSVKLVLITNGSMVQRENVQAGLTRMAECNGEVWFKIDAGTEEGRLQVNGVPVPEARVVENLRLCSKLVSTRIQTCMFMRNGKAPSQESTQAYLDLIASQLKAGAAIKDVMLYGLARESHQPAAPELSTLSDEWLLHMAGRIRALGVPVSAYGTQGLLA